MKRIPCNWEPNVTLNYIKNEQNGQRRIPLMMVKDSLRAASAPLSIACPNPTGTGDRNWKKPPTYTQPYLITIILWHVKPCKDFSFSSNESLRGWENSFPSFNEPQVQVQSSFRAMQ